MQLTKRSGNKTQVATCKHPPLIKVELNKTSPSYLHLLLGIVRHLDEASHAIDVKITKQEDDHLTELENIIGRSGSKHRCR